MQLLLLVLFAQVVDAPARDRVRLTDADRFRNNYDLKTTIREAELAQAFFRHCQVQARCTRGKEQAKWRERMFAQVWITEAWENLVQVHRKDLTAQELNALLDTLHNDLRSERYKAGRMPPPVPPEIRQDFEVWLKKQGK